MEAAAISCADCGVSVIRRGRTQVYCETCSIKRDRDRKRLWAQQNSKPITQEKSAAMARRRLEKRAEANALQRPSAAASWVPGAGLDFAWYVRVGVPFSWSLSKNAVWSMALGGGHVFMRRRATAARDVVRATIAGELAKLGATPVEAKVYLDIFVQKSSHRGDAINMLDSVCDGVKDAVGVDDRWFSIRGLDWEIVKSDPKIFVGVGQVERVHHRACSWCGVIQPLTGFGISTHDRLGHAKECRECRRITGRKRN